uniref:Pre-mRNA-splicing factor 38 n=1 Tax=Globodera pallida TaxID=36090 RepID=A0A183CL28_GLOPA
MISCLFSFGSLKKYSLQSLALNRPILKLLEDRFPVYRKKIEEEDARTKHLHEMLCYDHDDNYDTNHDDDDKGNNDDYG